jgi:hypothetical protein
LDEHIVVRLMMETKDWKMLLASTAVINYFKIFIKHFAKESFVPTSSFVMAYAGSYSFTSFDDCKGFRKTEFAKETMHVMMGRNIMPAY